MNNPGAQVVGGGGGHHHSGFPPLSYSMAGGMVPTPPPPFGSGSGGQQQRQPFPGQKLPDRSAHLSQQQGGGSRLQSQQQQQMVQQQGQAVQGPQRDEYNGLSDEQREEINDAFQLFDLDKDGRISYQEFRVALKALGFSLEKPDLFAYMTAHGVPPVNWQPPASSSKAGAAKSSQHDGGATCPPPKLQLTQASFQAIAGALVYARDPREEMLRAFRLFDADDKGVITVDDLRRVAREIGEDISEEELASMIEEFDMNGKGGVGQEEFLAIVSDD